MDYMPFEQTGHKCLVCGADNLLSFVDLTLVTSRTSQSNTPVRDKLKSIIKHKWLNVSDVMILCAPCFNMVERYDQLESELQVIQSELSSKYAQTLGPDFEQRLKDESKKNRRGGADEDQEGLNWQRQVPVDLLQPVVNLTADGESGDDSVNSSDDSDGDDDSDETASKKARNSTDNDEKGEDKEKKPYTGKPRGRPRKDAPRPRTPTPPPPAEEPKIKPVFEYDHNYKFFKDGERLRTGQVLTDGVSLTTYIHCIYCSDRFKDARSMSSHAWHVHRPHIVSTSVASDGGGQQECNFGVQLVKVTADSQAQGRPFMCIFCDATFKFKSNLLQHFRENHSPIKPFSCIECKAKFRRSIEVSRHRVYYCPSKKPIPGGRNDDEQQHYGSQEETA